MEVISLEPLRDELFLVTWQESDNTTVVHIEVQKNNTLITNITSPPDPAENPATPMQFAKFNGKMRLIS